MVATLHSATPRLRSPLADHAPRPAGKEGPREDDRPEGRDFGPYLGAWPNVPIQESGNGGMVMNVSAQSQARTRLFARVLGPFLVIVDATAVARASEMQTLLSQFEANSLWTWVTGAFILLFGLTVVAAHPYWR